MSGVIEISGEQAGPARRDTARMMHCLDCLSSCLSRSVTLTSDTDGVDSVDGVCQKREEAT